MTSDPGSYRDRCERLSAPQTDEGMVDHRECFVWGLTWLRRLGCTRIEPKVIQTTCGGALRLTVTGAAGLALDADWAIALGVQR